MTRLSCISNGLMLIGLCSAGYVSAQKTDTLRNIVLKGVTVTAYQEESPKQTTFNLTPLYVDSLTRLGNFNLTDLLAKTPGVRMLSTGPAISKPVIRGLYGNRIVVLLSGLKFDNQQWQEEHGLGLSDIGLSRVEVIKGPISVLYGSEAMGGVINLVEEQKPAYGERETDASIKFNSNTLGGLLQAGMKINYGKHWFKVRAGVENHADYLDGNNDRVLNSRSDGYYLKGTYGFQRKHWTSVNNYMGTYNRFGFIFDDLYSFLTPDNRWSRRLSDKPAHLVLLNILSSENRIRLCDDSKLNINLGLQSNWRREDEGGGAVSLNMHLLTIQYLAKWEKDLSAKHALIISNLGSFEDNTNYGARKIVPDATLQESNVSVYLKTQCNDNLNWENGLGIGEKWIKTYFTPLLNGPDKEIQPFSKTAVYYNAFTGLSFNPGSRLNIKANIATGVRIPNLAELASDGLHEGVFTYEIGSPDLKNEQNIAVNFSMDFEHPHFRFGVSPFYNYFLNYVFLAPTSEEWFGFPVYRYLQQDARQYGTECSLTVIPQSALQLHVTYEGMVSRTTDGFNTPFTPAQKLTPGIDYTIHSGNLPLSLFANLEYYFRQDNTYPGEITTPDYALVNAGISTTLRRHADTYELSLTGNNLLNRAYYDHLSRFKYFGLLNMGRNVVLMFRAHFRSELADQ